MTTSEGKILDTILLVEDDYSQVLLMQRAFRKANIQNPLQVLQDGEAAVQYLAGDPPYDNRERYPLPVVVLLDLKLPRKSGHEVLKWLRQQPELKRLPVVILSSSRETVDVNLTYDLGANSYLVKPVNFSRLEEIVQVVNQYWITLNEKPEVNLY